VAEQDRLELEDRRALEEIFANERLKGALIRVLSIEAGQWRRRLEAEASAPFRGGESIEQLLRLRELAVRARQLDETMNALKGRIRG